MGSCPPLQKPSARGRGQRAGLRLLALALALIVAGAWVGAAQSSAAAATQRNGHDAPSIAHARATGSACDHGSPARPAHEAAQSLENGATVLRTVATSRLSADPGHGHNRHSGEKHGRVRSGPRHEHGRHPAGQHGRRPAGQHGRHTAAHHGGLRHGGIQHGGLRHGGIQHGGLRHGATRHGLRGQCTLDLPSLPNAGGPLLHNVPVPNGQRHAPTRRTTTAGHRPGAPHVATVSPSPARHNHNPAVGALRSVGAAISHVPGLSIFGGKHGWVLSGVLLLAIAMIAASGLLGRRRLAPSAARPPVEDISPDE